MSDAELVAHARERMGAGEAGLETAKRCIALVFERNRDMVRGLLRRQGTDRGRRRPGRARCTSASCAPSTCARTPIENPSGLLVIMAKRVIATYYERRKPAGAPLDDLPRGRGHEDGYDEAAADEVVEPAARLSHRAAARGRVGAGVRRLHERRDRRRAWRSARATWM